MSFEEIDKEPLINSSESTVLRGDADTGVYKRRWWILIVFCGCVISMGITFNTWGPITQSAEVYFGWSDGIIGLLANWSSITVLIFMIPMSNLMDKKGLRFVTLLCITLTFVGTGLRCITEDPTIATWLINLGHILNGISGTALVAAPPLLTVTWFPPHQRTTATALSMMSLAIGMAIAFVLGPQLVTTPSYQNVTLVLNTSNMSTTESNLAISNHSVLVNLNKIGQDIMFLMYIECGLAAVFFLAVLLYFPRRPPKPPSVTASLERVDFKKAFKSISKNRRLWLLTLSLTLPNGVFGNWSSVIDVVLIPVGVNQTDVGNIAAVATISGCVFAIIIARFSDIFMKHMKAILILLYVLAIGSFTWFILTVGKIIEFRIAYIWISFILGTMTMQGTNPLFFELACETAYPVAEGVTGGLLTLFNNVSGGIFLSVLLIPNIGTAWMNYCLIGGIGLGLSFLFLFQEQYTRINIDVSNPGPNEKPVQNTETSNYN